MVRKHFYKYEVSVPREWWGFKRGLIASPRCKGCERRCVVLYDGHHDEYFSATCGLVISEMGVFLVDY